MNAYPTLWKQARVVIILKIIFDLGRAVQLKEMVAITQGDHEAISKYCNVLATMGYITRTSNHAGWMLTAQGFAFMNPHQKADSPLISAEKPVNTITTTTKESDREVVVIKQPDSAFYSGNLDLYAEIGIMLNPQTEFIAQHVDPKTIRSEWQKLVDKGKPWPGLLIKILSNPRKPGLTDAQKRAKYAEWDQQRKP